MSYSRGLQQKECWEWELNLCPSASIRSQVQLTTPRLTAPDYSNLLFVFSSDCDPSNYLKAVVRYQNTILDVNTYRLSWSSTGTFDFCVQRMYDMNPLRAIVMESGAQCHTMNVSAMNNPADWTYNPSTSYDIYVRMCA